MRKHRRRSGRYRFLIIIIIIAAAAAVFRFAAGRRKSGETEVVSEAQDTVVAEGSTLLSPSSENPQASAGGPQSGPSVNSGSGISVQTASAQTSPAGGDIQPGAGTAPAGGDAQPGAGTAPAGGDAQPGAGTAPAGGDAQPGAGTASAGGDAQPGTGTAPAGGDAQPGTGTAPAGGDTQPGTGTAPVGGDAQPEAGTAPADSAVDAAANPAPPAEPTVVSTVGGTAATGETAQGEGAGEGAPPSGTDVSDGTSAQAASAPKKHVVSELDTGKAYLDSLDQRSPVEMEYRIDQARAVYEKEQDRNAYLKKREIYRQALEDDGVWDQFDKYVFLGDSRVVGFNVFGFLPEERVLAQQGDTILAISDRMDEIRELKPSYIFISYGINDIGIGIWPTAGEYADAFSEKIDDLHKALPDAQIYVNSIIPATDEAVEGVSIWGKIPEYSDALKNMCAEKGIPFIDNTKLMEEHKELYAGDGVHLLAEFYPYWAQNQLLGIYDLKNGRNSEGYKIGDKTGQASGQESGQDPAPDQEKTGEASLEDPASNKEKTGAD